MELDDFFAWADQSNVDTSKPKLHNFLIKHFSLEEIKTLCFLLVLDYDELGGDGKSGKARELIIHLDHKEQLYGLYLAAKGFRPGVDWPEFSLPPIGAGVDFSLPPQYEANDSEVATVSADALGGRSGSDTWQFESFNISE